MEMIYIANARIPTEKAHGGQIMKMCESFADLGLSVDLVLPQRCNRQFQGVSPFAYYQTKKNFQIKKIYCPDPFFLMNRGGLYIKVQSLFFSLRLFFYLIFKVDRDIIIYTRDEYLLPLATLFSRKVVWEAHDLPKFKKTEYWLKCSKIIAITNGLRQEIIDSGVPEKKILTAPDGVDLKMFENISGSREDSRSQLSLPQDEKIVLYAGHLYAWKGVDTLAEAARFFEDKKVKFVFVGGMSKDLEDFNKNYGQKKNILITGHVSQSLVPKYLMSADILVLPNSASSKISSSYTSPLKLFEYMASGRPIIASRLDSLREILTEKECVFFSPDDVRDLAEKIESLLSDGDWAKRIAAEAKKKARDYTWGNRAKNIVEFIKYV